MPGTDDDRLDAIADAVRRRGHALVPIAPDLEADPPRLGHVYTVGLADHDLPELVVLGLPPATARMVLSTLAEHVLTEAPLPAGVPLEGFFDGMAPVAREVDPGLAADRLPLALAWSRRRGKAPARAGVGARLRVTQIVWPDSAGHYPWEADFDDDVRIAQPLLDAPPARS